MVIDLNITRKGDVVDKVIIIAEAGVNHNGSIKMAKQLIDVAVDSGADFVKFQTFKANSLVTKKADKADYQKKLAQKDESHFEMIKRLELDKSAHEELISYCIQKNIQFLSTAFDIESANLLSQLDIKIYKIPSGEITNLPYLRHIGGLGKPVIMSTGMATLDEVRAAMNVLIDAGLNKNDLTILHCNTEYPTPMSDVNLTAMLTMKDELKVNIGYSDHTLGIIVSIASVAMGATVIEKHFTLDRKLAGPDHAASLEPDELKSMVKAIRNIEKAMGKGVKEPSPSEKKNIPIVRKSIVAKTYIKKGETFSKYNLAVKRPGTGISAMQWDNILGQKASKSFESDELIK